MQYKNTLIETEDLVQDKYICKNLEQAAEIVECGGIIAYPTESVWGLGCNPFNVCALQKLIHIKKRREDKGLILLTDSWSNTGMSVSQANSIQLIVSKYNKPVTIILDKVDIFNSKSTQQALDIVKGNNSGFAVRVPKYDLLLSMLKHMSAKGINAIVSTSANVAMQPPATTKQMVIDYFHDDIDFIVDATTQGFYSPSTIIEFNTGKILRT